MQKNVQNHLSHIHFVLGILRWSPVYRISLAEPQSESPVSQTMSRSPPTRDWADGLERVEFSLEVHRLKVM